MKSFRRIVLLIACVLVLATTASADDQGGDDGQPCATSFECGALKCIHERCRDPATMEREVHHEPSPGWAALFNDGHGYQMTILAADVAAACVVPALAALAFTGINGSINGVYAIAAIFPTTLTGPIILSSSRAWKHDGAGVGHARLRHCGNRRRRADDHAARSLHPTHGSFPRLRRSARERC